MNKFNELAANIEALDNDLGKAIDDLDLNLLSDLLDNRMENLRRMVELIRLGTDNGPDNEKIVNGIYSRGVLMRARIQNKLELVSRELKALEEGRKARLGYLNSSGCGTDG